MAVKAASFIFSLILVLMIGGSAVYFLQHPEDPLADLRALGELAPDTSKLTEKLFVKEDAKKLYRWQDLDGNWHYSDQPPEPNQEMEATGDHFQREMEAIRASSETVKLTGSIPAEATRNTTGSNGDLVIPGLPTPGTVMKIIDNVRNLEDNLQERERKIQEAGSVNSN